jgi:FAD/FMN-containing dehydrogenase/Fe-S oxidoreductase
MHADATDTWLDLSGLMPPLALDASRKILGNANQNASGQHTYLPVLVSETEFTSRILPQLQKNLAPEVVRFINDRVQATFRIRRTLARLHKEIVSIVGEGNFSALWLDREAFSADSMEHRALVTEAVIHVYSAPALGKLVGLLYRNDVPMIPYGEGGGYNMGVTPMAPAVTISVRGIDHISQIRPSRRSPEKYEITVGAGVPFKDLQEYLLRRGYVLRCDPNTPRAATGGIVATGSNGGRKIFEVTLEGRAVAANGSALRFGLDEFEQQAIENEPFLMAKKFFSIPESGIGEFERLAKRTLGRGHASAISAGCREITIPLIGSKAKANMAAQRIENAPIMQQRPNQFVQFVQVVNHDDPLASEAFVPLSCFVGAEGCTGFVYEVTLEIEKPKSWIIGARLHFATVETAMVVTRAIKGLSEDLQPVFFEVITGESIRRFLLEDFPTEFDGSDAAVLFVGVESNSEHGARNALQALMELALTSLNENSIALTKSFTTPPEFQNNGRPAFDRLIRPREALPKKLRTKCKTDMEIRTEYLADVLKVVSESSIRASNRFQKQDVMFGHLTPHKTAIIHWNIGGFDLYDEESAHAAWEYLEDVLSRAQHLAPKDDPHPSATFSGEHGIAGKASFLWINHIEKNDFTRMCRVKDALDPKGLFNPDTLFLRTSVARSLRARLIGFSTRSVTAVVEELKRSEHKGNRNAHSGAGTNLQQDLSQAATAEGALSFATAEALRCTRCNSCKICPVIDAEHELRRENPKKYKTSVLPSKRNLVMFLEWIVALKRTSGSETQTDGASLRAKSNAFAAKPPFQKMFREASQLLAKCFYCRKCDKACPVDINIHPMVQAFNAIGGIRPKSSFIFRFLYERLMGEDRFKDFTYRLGGLIIRSSEPLLVLARKLSFIPDWLKSYLSPPQFAPWAYEPSKHGSRLESGDNYVLIGPHTNPLQPTPTRVGSSNQQSLQQTVQVFIRYRGCMDTYSNPQASIATDDFFRMVLGVEFVDLEKKMCCGFPFEADGLKERAARSRFLSLVEIYRCVASIIQRTGMTSLAEARTVDPSGVGLHQAPPELRFTVFSNCPTCTEAIREMLTMLADHQVRERLRVAAKLPASFSFDASEARFEVLDTVEVAINLIEGINQRMALGERDAAKGFLLATPPQPINRHVGLKVPCHNSLAATAAQAKLLSLYYRTVSAYDRCCGLSGTGRLKHPKIGTKIAEKLFEQIREAEPETVVSGCPSCRDGVSIQRNILAARKDPVADFNVAGIFEQIVKDHGITAAP